MPLPYIFSQINFIMSFFRKLQWSSIIDDRNLCCLIRSVVIYMKISRTSDWLETSDFFNVTRDHECKVVT